MTLESTIICVDNSEFSRNGDFTPSRLGAQQDVLQTITRTKFRMNPENTCGLLAVGGSKPNLVNTLTSDVNKLLSGFAGVTHDGQGNNFTTGLRIAHLALKHRTSKNHRQRIVICVCSPLQETEGEMVKLAKKLKKENVNVDIINFGEDEVNVERLAKFIEVLNGKNTDPSSTNCHLVNIPSGNNLNDGVRQSQICGNDPSAAAASGGGVGGGMDTGGEDWMDDPNMDPDLALALRVSLEESRARQQQEAQQSNNQTNVPDTIQEEAAGGGQTATTVEATAASDTAAPVDADDEMLMQALQMSLAPEHRNDDDDVQTNQAEDEEDADDDVEDDDEVPFDQMTEEQQIEYALKMSLADNNNGDDDDDMEE